MSTTQTEQAVQRERVVFDELELGEIALELDDQTPQDVIQWGLETFGDYVAMVTAFQVDGMAVLDMAYRIRPELRVVTVDTGRLPRETYEFIEQVRQRYPKARLEVYFPDAHQVEVMVNRNGVNLFYQDVPKRLLCCHVRKVRPLLRALSGLDAWFTGLRRDQWASRSNIRKAEIDHDHHGIVKINPLADWSEQEVWDYVREHDVPTHPLYARGYTSIGCGPCTRPIKPGEDSRAGRWWWEKNAPKECGIHCPIETGGFEHEAHAILGDSHKDGEGI
ncbi:MAG TPA: phosphoadenylyl-sulfate reductase [Phycisphaeraceae bacterium]